MVDCVLGGGNCQTSSLKGRNEFHKQYAFVANDGGRGELFFLIIEGGCLFQTLNYLNLKIFLNQVIPLVLLLKDYFNTNGQIDEIYYCVS